MLVTTVPEAKVLLNGERLFAGTRFDWDWICLRLDLRGTRERFVTAATVPTAKVF